jgi:antirestriction protein ArdC
MNTNTENSNTENSNTENSNTENSNTENSNTEDANTRSTSTRSGTTTAAKSGRTIEEKKAQAEALHDSISTQVEDLRNTEQWTKFLAFATAFHTYSLNNLLLILSQRPDATQVAGFRKWQGLGRQVRTGEKSIKIFGYSTKKVTKVDENGDSQERQIARFPILSVFDTGQTNPIEGVEVAGSITAHLTGADDFGIIDTLSAHLVENGWTVERQSIPGDKNGYTNPEQKLIVLDANLSREHMAKTLIHETAHVLLGHTENMTEYTLHRGLMETEAESVAYIVAGLIGFDTSGFSIGYIAGWADADTELIKSTAGRVLHTAHQIAGILAPSTEKDDADAPGSAKSDAA